MQDQIFPLNVDPESPLKQVNKKKKPTFKQWFNERKRMLGLVLTVCLVTVGVIVYPFLNLGEFFKGQMIGGGSTDDNSYSLQDPSKLVVEEGSVNITLPDDPKEGDNFTVKFNMENGNFSLLPPYIRIGTNEDKEKMNVTECQLIGEWQSCSFTGTLLPGENTIEIGTVSFNAPYDWNQTWWKSDAFEVTENINKEISSIEIGEGVPYYLGGKIETVRWEEDISLCNFIKNNGYKRYIAIMQVANPPVFEFTSDDCNASSDGKVLVEVTGLPFELNKKGTGGLMLGYKDGTSSFPLMKFAEIPQIEVIDNLIEDSIDSIEDTTPGVSGTINPSRETWMSKVTVDKDINTLAKGDKINVTFEGTSAFALGYGYWNANKEELAKYQITLINASNDEIASPTQEKDLPKLNDATDTVESFTNNPENFQFTNLFTLNKPGEYYVSLGVFMGSYMEIWNNKGTPFVVKEALTLEASNTVLSSTNLSTTFDYNIDVAEGGIIAVYQNLDSTGGDDYDANNSKAAATFITNIPRGTWDWDGKVSMYSADGGILDKSAAYVGPGEYNAQLIVNDTVRSAVMKITVQDDFINKAPTISISPTVLSAENRSIKFNYNTNIDGVEGGVIMIYKGTGDFSATDSTGVATFITNIPIGTWDWDGKVSMYSADGGILNKSAAYVEPGDYNAQLIVNDTIRSAVTKITVQTDFGQADTTTPDTTTPDTKTPDTTTPGTTTPGTTTPDTTTPDTTTPDTTTPDTTTPGTTTPATLTASFSTATTADEVIFALKTPTGGTCIIEFGDGQKTQGLTCEAGIEFTAKHKYASAGTYTVIGRVNGVIAKDLLFTVTAVTTPAITISVNDRTPEIKDGDDDVEVTFTLTATNLTGPYSYQIDYDDGDKDFSNAQTSNTHQFKHKYEENDEYEVTASVTDSTGLTKTATLDLEVTLEEVDEDEEDKEVASDIKITNVSSSKNNFDPLVNTTEIRYTINDTAEVTVDILDSAKKKVLTLLDKKKQTKGAQTVVFKGTVANRDNGQVLPGGSYTYSISAVDPNDKTNEADTKSGVVTLIAAGQFSADWEQAGSAVALNGTSTGTSAGTSSTTTTPTRTTTPLSTTTSKTSNLAALTMQNSPPVTTAGTGPEMLIYLVFPAISAFLLNRKK